MNRNDISILTPYGTADRCVIALEQAIFYKQLFAFMHDSTAYVRGGVIV